MMDNSIVVTLVVGVVTLACSYIIYRIQKIRRYPGELSLTIKELFRVMSNAPGQYKNLALTYENYHIKDDLFYIKICLFNEQSYDCLCVSESQPIIIMLPAGVKWIDAKVVGESQDVMTTIRIRNDKELGISFKLLRRNEYLTIEGLLESSLLLNQDKLEDTIVINHRIPNFRSVKKVSVLSSSSIKRAKHRAIFQIVYFGLMILLFIMSFMFRERVSPIKYIEKESGIERAFYLNKDNQLVYADRTFPWTRYSKPITKEEFITNYSTSWENNRRIGADLYFVWGMMAIVVILTLLMFIPEVSSLSRTKRIDKIINQ